MIFEKIRNVGQPGQDVLYTWIKLRREENMKQILMLLTLTIILGCSAQRQDNLGLVGGKLLPCPNSPNCVSTQSPKGDHYIDPIHYTGNSQQAKDAIVSVIRRMKRAQIVTVTDDYIHAEFTSTIFRFVDDVEFYFDDSGKVIHMRSASRVGYSDFGVNRKRMEEIRSRYNTFVEK
jgi:uncharacterized protein (DUF1499 family)